MADNWTEPGAFEVAPDAGVYRIPLPLPNDGLRAVNVYAIADGDSVVLIDGGWALAESEHLLTKCLDEIGYRLSDIREFLVTHAHRDHYTQAVAIRRSTGASVSLGEGEAAALRAITTGEPRHFDQLQRAGAGALIAQLAAHARDPSERDGWEPPDTWLTSGTRLRLRTRTLRVIATPGHTRGHVVFFDEAAGALFAGDHVLPHITPSVGFEPAPAALPLGDYLDSLRLVRSLPDAVLLPAHGPIAPSVHVRADELLDHHEARLAATSAAVERGADTAFEAARLLRWTRHERAFADLDPFNQMLATTETMAHLDVLVARSLLSRSVATDQVAHYLPA